MISADIDVSKEEKTSAREFLKSLATSRDGCVYVVRDRIRWSFYIKNGQLVYASHSLDSFERLERHLRSLGREVPALTEKIRSQLRLIFDDPAPANAKYKVTSEILCGEYLAWQVN